jgi:uncharacterized membrane protein
VTSKTPFSGDGSIRHKGGVESAGVVSLPFLILIAGAIAYSCFFTYLTFARLESFNSSINDLGYYNQLYWISLHGGPAAWVRYTQIDFHAQFPVQTLVYAILLPAYAVSPTPYTLLVAQGVAVPLAAVPIYLLARHYRFSQWVSLGFAGVYLLNFQMESVSLNDFHLQTLYPAIFFAMILMYERGHSVAFVGLATLSMVTNPLTLALTLAFIGAQVYNRVAHDLGLSAIWSVIRRWVRSSSPEFWVVTIGISLLILEFATGTLSGYHFGQVTTSGGPTNYITGLDDRLIYFTMTFAPFLIVGVLVPESAITVLPLVAFLALGNISYFGYYGRQDTVEFLVVGLWGLMLFSRSQWIANIRRDLGRTTHGAVASIEPRVRPSSVPVTGALAISLVLFLLLSPISPWNDQPQLLQDINVNPVNITNITLADKFLDKAIDLIPEDASVLTQNNIPQLTGRLEFNWPFPGKPAPNISKFNYILGDDSSQFFARYWYVYLKPFIDQALGSGEFGTVAIGYGVLLLERGYTGSPELSAPIPFPALDLPLASGYLQSGIAVHTPGSSATFWYGPYIDLPAGAYTATFSLMISSIAEAGAPVIKLAAENYTNGIPVVFTTLKLFEYNFPAALTWTSFAINFTLNESATEVQLPGLLPTNVSTIYFAGVTVTLGHTGSLPEIHFPIDFDASEFSLSSGYFNGSAAIHDAENNSTFWYGPYCQLGRGNYTAYFELMATSVTEANLRIITLAVVDYVNQTPDFFNQSAVVASEISSPGMWTGVELNFTLDQSESELQFIGISPTNAGILEFDGVTLDASS